VISVRARARVRNGRLVVHEPTDLPEGTEVELVAERPMTAEEFKAWLATIPIAEERLSPKEAAELRRIGQESRSISHEELKAKLAARRNGKT
jgi:arsenate reductase-like glutaredoxin family protein